ncbi:uncharacterized protein DUF1801 [Lacinutrix venerupis]|uniref:2-dehydro-3-deoxyphosphooctonate aldolase n=1 Tax=Lacinutrix venerupis TaxID=1486034 RepID=A0AAC9PXH7_9FLAO|nr:DUF1801 domain-containing protein [Lacinutrix venerupis]APY00940.1 2-dehydro-3-deoxyphosphooctonate aldolase [Lacinutrix venerupis]RLJ67134.1 uncharacterized protein DUF1801 [Lacinutrix venerupis]
MNPAEAYILNQPEPYRAMLLHVQVIIEHTIPEVELKYKWRIPCYYVGKKPICYLNASHKHEFVDVAFWHSNYITKYTEHLFSEKRKVVKSLRYKSLEDIKDAILISVLQQVNNSEENGFYKKE